MMPPTPAGPLDGVTVLDLCSYLAGPYGCTLLADLGAMVIKIEAPQGDMLRQFPSSLPGESRFFLGTNRGKRAIALDLSVALGVGAAIILPLAGPILRPLAKNVIKGGILAYQGAAGLIEAISDLAAEAAAETGGEITPPAPQGATRTTGAGAAAPQ